MIIGWDIIRDEFFIIDVGADTNFCIVREFFRGENVNYSKIIMHNFAVNQLLKRVFF